MYQIKKKILILFIKNKQTMCICDRENFLIVEYVGHERAMITRKTGPNFLPSKTSDCRILGGGGYILGGVLWWGYILGSGGW